MQKRKEEKDLKMSRMLSIELAIEVEIMMCSKVKEVNIDVITSRKNVLEEI